MKKIRYIALIFCLLLSVSAGAIKSNEVTQEDELLKQGYSDDMVRMVNLQKSRTEPGEAEEPATFWDKHIKNSRLTKFFRNLFYERDITMPLEQFGEDRVRTVESPSR